MIDLRQLTQLVALGDDWGETFALVERGCIPPPVFVGDLARWRRTDIDPWMAAGCPAGEPMADEDADRLLDCLSAEVQRLRESITQEQPT